MMYGLYSGQSGDLKRCKRSERHSETRNGTDQEREGKTEAENPLPLVQERVRGTGVEAAFAEVP